MKKTIILTGLSICLTAVLWACDSKDDKSSSSTDSTGGGTEWELVWSEEFDTDGYLDESVWTKLSMSRIGYRATWCNYMADYDELYDVKDGNLILRGVYNGGEDSLHPTDTCTYLTGGVWTQDKVEFLGEESRLVIRAKFDSAQGAWPAFWMKPTERDQQDKKSEIDIMEHINFETYVLQTNWDYYIHNNSVSTSRHQGKGNISLSGYNEYAVEVHSDRLIFQTNDETTLTYSYLLNYDADEQFPYCTHPFYLIIDMQIEGEAAGTATPSQYPVEVWIDWIRYYRPKK